MCTVSFIPLSERRYLLTSNRDERTTRPSATPPLTKNEKNYIVMYPGDPQGGGTWIAADNRLNAVCLLNGAFQPHKPEYPYRQSRGLVVLDSFNSNQIYDFFDLYDLTNIEPFTLVIIHDFELYEFRWDGENRTLTNHPFNQPKIWSSVTLYDDSVIKKREEWFSSWIKKEAKPDIKKILQFHCFGGEGNRRTDLVMEQAHNLKTLSITSVLVDEKRVEMVYKDLIHKKQYRERLNSKFKILKN